MIQTFTPNDIIRYIYKETSEQENARIENALLSDRALLEIFKEFSLIKRQLERAMHDPHEHVIDHVLAYSKSLDQHA